MPMSVSGKRAAPRRRRESIAMPADHRCPFSGLVQSSAISLGPRPRSATITPSAPIAATCRPPSLAPGAVQYGGPGTDNAAGGRTKGQRRRRASWPRGSRPARRDADFRRSQNGLAMAGHLRADKPESHQDARHEGLRTNEQLDEGRDSKR